MPTDKEILAERLRERLAQDDRTPREISMAATGKPDTIRDILRGRSMPGSAILAALAAQFDTTSDYLLGRSQAAAQPVSEVAFREAPRGFRREFSGMMPIWGTAYCDDLAVEGEDGKELEVERVLLDTDHTIRMIERPPALHDAKDTYAIYLQGASMEPRFEQGELAVVDPRRPPRPRDYVVAQLNDGESNDVMTVLVKRLVRVTSAHYELEQFNPPSVFRVPRSQVVRLHRICTANDLWNV